MKKAFRKAGTSDNVERNSIFVSRLSSLSKFHSFSGKEVLNQILELDNPRRMIQDLAGEDFYWLVKKVGENDCIPLLELASEEQWQYLLDLELWTKDLMHMEQAYSWMGRLQLADNERLARWFFNEGQSFAYYFLFKNIQVEIKNDEEIYDLDQGVFTFDGIYFIKVLDNNQRDLIKNILRIMADEDLNRYHAMLLGLPGVLPAETEEEMYRLKNMRLAEHGFLPFEEALSVYSPLTPESVTVGRPPLEFKGFLIDESDRGLVPASHLFHAGSDDLFSVTVSRMTNGILLDRIALEFAGLCNRILSADGILTGDLDVIVNTCKKASGYLNIALERLCKGDTYPAEEILGKNSLISLFQVGFGLALALKWETEDWIEKSWFEEQALEFDFWGEWGGTLAGLTEKRPCLYIGFEKGEEFRDFEKLSEIDETRRLVGGMRCLDRLFRRLAGMYTFDKKAARRSGLTFYQFLFNLWARQLLKLGPCFSGISYKDAKEFFALLRANEKKPPYRMTGFEEAFIKYFMDYAYGFETEAALLLRDTLTVVWREFREEHEWMDSVDPKGKYNRFILITPFPESPVR